MKNAIQLAKEGNIVTFGIKPTKPETGYGYLEFDGNGLLSFISHEVDENENMVIGTEIHTTFLGLRNTIFVLTKNANLILQKNKAQNVKKIYNNALNKVDSMLID